VTNELHAILQADLKAQPVPGRVAVREHGARLHLSQRGLVANDRMPEVLLPLEQIADGREQARRAIRVVVRDGDVPPVLLLFVGGRTALHEHRVVVVKVRPRHA
jgi:hypothetical protein